MSTNDRSVRRRGSLARRLDDRVSTNIDAETGARIRAAAERYGLAVGVVVREAIASGLTPALERLRLQHKREATRGANADRPEKVAEATE